MNILRQRKPKQKTSLSPSEGSTNQSLEEEKPRPQSLEPSPGEKPNEPRTSGQEQASESSSIVSAGSKSSASAPAEVKKKVKPSRGWGCVDTCCWLIGCICVVWWFLLVLYHAMPSLPQYVTDAITGPLPDPPGLTLKREGVRVRHPVVFVPGIVTGGLELWEGHPCADGLFRKRLWGGTFGEVYKRPLCWVEHMSLDNITGLDPPGVRVRPVSGLVAADYFAPGYFVWAVLIENLARVGYEEKTMHMAAYDWRLSFQNTEVRDKSLSRLKSTIELMVQINEGRKVVSIPHSMGVIYFLHFLKWVEAPLPMGGGGGPDWCAQHIKAVMNIGGPLLGVPKAVAGLFSSEDRDIAVARAIAPGLMDSEILGLQTLQHIMRMTRTWDSTMSMIPKGGDTIWGGVDWSPEEGYECSKRQNHEGNRHKIQETTDSSGKGLGPGRLIAHYGRILSFGKDAAQAPSSTLQIRGLKEACCGIRSQNNVSCGDVWTEYHEISSESIQKIAENKVYTARTIPELLRLVAPQTMHRGDGHFSYGLADNLDDPKYQHHKYWSNPLETKLPNAPDMEVYCMYGVGILTERSYIYKVSPDSETCYIPFRIDTSAEGNSEGCLKGGVHFVDGDETVPVLSSGFMCAKGWRGKTRFNPSGSATFIREYDHAPPSNLLEGRGTQSGSHVDIMGNFGLIEDVLRVATGATGQDIGGDRVHSDLLKWSERIPLIL